MIDNEKTCELLLYKYLVEKNQTEKNYFQNSLDKDILISKYIDSDKCNLNYVQLLVKSVSTQDLVLASKLRLKAKRKEEREVELLFSNQGYFTYGVELSYSNELEKTDDIKTENGHLYLTYSLK
ncbi:hypothetical protein SD457_10585 [Coprobacillaceae bacterium CR2/5/TPMF4]|nr:hypothetical protein SD457_10585 [Coprobacillaceae bacterium CR2/5/TPMF4]